MAVWENLEVFIIASGLSADTAFDIEQEYLDIHWKYGLLNKRKNAYKVSPVLYKDVSELFYLNEEGQILWKVDRMGGIRMKIFSARKDTPAGYIGKRGYWHIRVNGKSLKLHRVVWALFNKQDLDRNLTIDHIDGNKSNNHPTNLRAVSQAENNRNCRRQLSELNIPRIRFSENQQLFHVQWTNSKGKKLHKYFTMKTLLKVGVSYEDAYDECLKSAVEFNDNLVID